MINAPECSIFVLFDLRRSRTKPCRLPAGNLAAPGSVLPTVVPNGEAGAPGIFLALAFDDLCVCSGSSKHLSGPSFRFNSLPASSDDGPEKSDGKPDDPDGKPDSGVSTGSYDVPKIDYPKVIDDIAGPVTLGESRESRISIAARRLGLPFRKTRALYYREITDPKTSVHLKFEEFVQSLSPWSDMAERLARLEKSQGRAA